MPQRSSEKATTHSKRRPPQEQEKAPDWPALQPLVPTTDLALETLLEDQIILIRNLFTSTLCKKFVSLLSSLPLTTTPVKPKEGEAIRVNDRIQYDDPAFAEQLWSSTGLQSLVNGSGGYVDPDGLTYEGAKKLWGGEVCGLNPRIRIYRYGQGQFFGQHYDESNQITLPSTPPTPARTTWTLLIYLSGPATGCVGGETVFYPELGPAKQFSGKAGDDGTEPVVVDLEVGMALLHKHGRDCLLHEGRRVEEGEKWVIRSDLCVKR